MPAVVPEALAHPIDTPVRSPATTSEPANLLRMRCSSSHAVDLCLCCGIADSDVQRLDEFKFGRRKVRTGQTLYREGERFQFFYVVRSGTFRSNLVLADGREQVNDFYLTGEIMGLDGVAYGAHASSATSLEDAEVCVVPYAQLIDLTAGNSSLQLLLGRLMSREILRGHSLLLLLVVRSIKTYTY
ncbi:MAG: cyclic nucleotide-binding domain-containing protein [Polaromonas sp.]